MKDVKKLLNNKLVFYAVAALAVVCKYLQPQGAWCLLQGQGARQPAVLWLL